MSSSSSSSSSSPPLTNSKVANIPLPASNKQSTSPPNYIESNTSSSPPFPSNAIVSYRLLEALRTSDLETLDSLSTPTHGIPSLSPDLLTKYGSILLLAISLAPTRVCGWLLTRSPNPTLLVNTAHPITNETPLHVVARTARLDLLSLLLAVPGINDGIKDASFRRPIDVACNDSIRRTLADFQESFIVRMTTQMHALAASGDLSGLKEMFRDPRTCALIDFNRHDPATGLTVLHTAARLGNEEMVKWCLSQQHADPFVRDRKGKYFYEITKNDDIRALFKQFSVGASPMTTAPNQMPTLSGFIEKWTNLATGYKARWFVLEEGSLSYYKNQEDVLNSCRGSIYLKTANLWVDSSDRHRFDIIGKGSIRYHLRAEHVAEASRWIHAISQTKAQLMDMQRHTLISRKNSTLINSTSSVLNDYTYSSSPPTIAGDSTANDASRRGSMESVCGTLHMDSDDVEDVWGPPNPPQETQLNMAINGLRAQLDMHAQILNTIPNGATENALGLVTRSISGLVDELLLIVKAREDYWRQRTAEALTRHSAFEEAIANLAKEYQTVEQEARSMATTLRRTQRQAMHAQHVSDKGGVLSDDHAVKATNDPLHAIKLSPTTLNATLLPNMNSPSDDGSGSDSDDENDDEFFDAVDDEVSEDVKNAQQLITPSLKGYDTILPQRKNLPVDHALLRQEVSLWSVLKHAIGKDLSRITLPVYFNEPLSMLQRLCEEIEYSVLLDLAWKRERSDERLLLVAAFAVSSYASTVGRVGKPFNPLLGETFEYVRKDRGFRYVSEQVSHHPPVSACYCESDRYQFYGEANVRNKFWGKSLEISPLGVCHVVIKRNHVQEPNEHYTWRKVKTTVHNIIVGQLWIDHHGELEVTNHTTGERCVLNFKPTGWRNKDRAVVEGKLFTVDGEATWTIQGAWEDKLVAKPIHPEQHAFSLIVPSQDEDRSMTSLTPPNPTNPEDGGGGGNKSCATSILVRNSVTIWKRYATQLSASNFNLTPFAMTLNQSSEVLARTVCKTDSRNRPDQRAMEEGRYNEASEEKSRLEEKQRQARKDAEEENGQHQHVPRWFVMDRDPDSNDRYWRFNHEYWACREAGKWEGVPDIY